MYGSADNNLTCRLLYVSNKREGKQCLCSLVSIHISGNNNFTSSLLYVSNKGVSRKCLWGLMLMCRNVNISAATCRSRSV